MCLLLCPCCDQPLVSSDQRPLHSRYIYFVHQWNPVKAFYGFDSSSPLPKQHHKRETAREENTSLSPLLTKELQHASDSRRDVLLCSRPTGWDSQENISNALLHPHRFCTRSHFLVLNFQFILRFDRTTARGDISFFFYFHHFDLIIMPLLFQDLDSFHVFSRGR